MMFGTQTRLLFVAIVSCFFAVTVLGTQTVFTADFTETRQDKPNAYATGKLYYMYDSDTPKNSRLRFEYTLDNNQKVSNLYHYEDAAIYSMCDVCTGLRTTEGADPWYYVSSIYTSTGKTEAGLTWYNRQKVAAGSETTAQVSSILMSSTTSPNVNVKKIVFADGRTIELSNQALPSTPSSTDNMFKPVSGCPKPTCPIYADLIFVLDNSNSVSDKSWRDGGNFVDAVMQSFTFGDDAVEAAIIHFNAPPAYPCTKKTVYGCQKCSDDYTFVSGYDYPGYGTAEIIAGLDQGSGVTVSPDRIALERVMNATRPKRSGQTCQGYGLELAMRVLDRSPRRKYSKVPQPIVIAVTDGADWCPNRTEQAANDLRKKYGAFVAEIGVALESGCGGYDKDYLRRIASKVGGSNTPAYYDVSNYAAIHTVTEQLFKPICDDYNTECGPDCHGFCGCGKCFCPKCNSTGSTCLSNTCVADGKSSTGCVVADIPCDKGNVCVSYKCHGDKTGSNRCEPIYNQCESLKKKYPGTCYDVSCDPSTTDGCTVKIKADVCSKLSNSCEEFECTPLDEAGADPITGCRVKTNKTQQLIDQLEKDGRKACFRAKCDKKNGVTAVDICESEFPLCYPKTCTKTGDKKYECKQGADINRPSDTKCVTYKCSSDKTKGWVVATTEDEKTCESKFTEEELKCHNIFCDPAEGCVRKFINGCASQCTTAKTAECIATGYSDHSSTGHCVLGSCIVIPDPSNSSLFSLGCDYTASVANCFDTMASEVEQLNKANPSVCYTPACGSNGRCTYETVPVPTEVDPNAAPVTECMEYVCKKQSDKSWAWEYVPTEVNLTCKTDDCSFRECRVGEGCYVEDTCRVQSTECATFSCDVSGASPKCVYVNTTLIETECTKEICNNGKIELTQKDLTEACNPPDKCYYSVCVDGACKYEKVEPPGNDPCSVYTCDPATGDWKITEKCTDGLFCTQDICTVFGECKYTPISCSDELDMDNYPCFVAACKEDVDDHRCVRKLMHNAYIDVCGNCIVEKEDSESQSGSYFAPKSESVDLLECTEAPPKPILTEGLAAATIALIILAAVLVGAGITASGVVGTKTLIDRAKSANNQTAHSNPLFEENDTEMSNPAYTGE